MTDEDFTLQQIAKNVPAPYRAKGLRHHRAAKHRRAVLRDMVGRWVGIQEQGLRRALPEVHKRFFYRFGVDIGTAFTLGEKDTDKLIDTIQPPVRAGLEKMNYTQWAAAYPEAAHALEPVLAPAGTTPRRKT